MGMDRCPRDGGAPRTRDPLLAGRLARRYSSWATEGWVMSEWEAPVGMGPVDVAIIGFPGNKFTGKLVPALMELVENGTVRVLDLLFVSKDADGVVSSFHVADLDAESQPSFLPVKVEEPGALGPEDAEEIAEDLEPNSSAALLAWENLWAARFVDALRDADAVVIDQIRIPADVAEAVLSGS